MTTGGYKLGASASVDASASVSAGGVLAGSSFDLGVNTSPQAVRNVVQFGVSNSSGVPVDGFDVEVKIQWSEDNTNWPDAGKGSVLISFVDSTVGASMTRSEWLELPEPKARYGRFYYTNNNTTDAVTVNSAVAQHTLQSV